MDNCRQQRSLALNHIPPLPITHGLEYPLGTRMHLCVVHLRLEARGIPFPRSPRSGSRVNPRVLRPLTRRPQGQPSPLRTPHGRPGGQGIFPTSGGQAPHGWPMVHHSMAPDFPMPRDSLPPLVPWFATPRRPIPLCHVLSPVTAYLPRFCLPISRACCAALTTHLSRSQPLSPPSRVYTPPGRQQPCGAGPAYLHPSGEGFVRLARVAPFPPPFVWVVCFSLDLLGVELPCPAPASSSTRAYSPSGHLQLFFFLRASRGPSSAPFALSRTLAACSLCALRPLAVRCRFFSGLPPPPPFELCIPPCCFLPLPRTLVFFTLLPACRHVSTALVIGSRLPSMFVSGPIALMGRAPWRSPATPARRPTLASLSFLPSLLSPPLPPPTPVSRPPSYCCSPAPCALRCSSPCKGCVSSPLTRLLASALSCVL